MKPRKPKVSTTSSAKTPGTPTLTGKRFGIVSFHEGELSSRTDSPATMSFAYFRTKSGLPPDVEKARALTISQSSNGGHVGKVIDKGLVPPDDPMFLGGPSLFSPQKFKPSTTNSQTATAGDTKAKPEQDPQELPKDTPSKKAP